MMLPCRSGVSALEAAKKTNGSKKLRVEEEEMISVRDSTLDRSRGGTGGGTLCVPIVNF